MKALPLEQSHLLELQQTDLAIAKAAHEYRGNPLHEEIRQLQGRAEDLRAATVAFEADLQACGRKTRGIEDEIEKVRSRRELQQDRLEQGKVPMRDMSALQHEIAQMDVRISDLENELLEAMGEGEEIEAKILTSHASAEAITADLEAAQAALAQFGTEIQARVDELRARRDQLIELIPEPVVKEYQRLQSRLGVSVVIEVKDGRPLSSPVDFSLAELAEIAATPKDHIYLSDDYEYMVVRTES
ncbi:hypothetical protein FYJ24_09800 [Actinomycetaceae bacterium WB03_NA08]|uniref:CT398-like coiled coil hairpin domain-containing protein n=1 Tax=Scrofimicrobium canadense TaxID=2652290 RepID=A0A6N7VVP3_9ACTO|nr:hypothetical protein [Scrofimicrobium canadense]MSS85050.1 hypothetical protein [Scrofimicrobium canadense]